MPVPEHVVIVIREWLTKAENDLRTAVHTLTLRDDTPTDTVCFHAQQCIEKYMKAILVSRSIAFPKTHNLDVLLSLMPLADRPALSKLEQVRITKYAVITRYSDAGQDIRLPEARKAVAIARRVRKQARRILPRKALRARKSR